jgi:putative Mn2+ efflux pump MntP
MKPAETSDQEANQRPSLLEYVGMVGCFVPILAVIGLVSWGTASLLHSLIHLPMWLGIPLGLAVGVWFVFEVLPRAENSTLMELAITCAILAILGAMLIPVFMEAREKNRQRRKKQEPSAISTTHVRHTMPDGERRTLTGTVLRGKWAAREQQSRDSFGPPLKLTALSLI